jgi:hypothetical protein
MATRPLPLQPLCPICNKPVDLKTCKTDHNGEAVHEDCYFFRVHNELNGVPKKPQRRVIWDIT